MQVEWRQIELCFEIIYELYHHVADLVTPICFGYSPFWTKLVLSECIH